ncbi:MAG: arsenic efflux protein [Bacilli bacterium]|nr:arsenic efflux protein [Bacilli bacterium]
MKHILLDTLFESLNLLPFLLITFLIIEFIEHKASKKSIKMLTKTKKYGPIIGGILGATPQCGLGVMATNLYATNIITIGTLIAIYLSTSDEMLPVLISEGMPFSKILIILLIKVIIGIICGFIIDFIFRKKNKHTKIDVQELCENEHCHCENSIIKSSLIHTLKTFSFIFLVSFVLHIFIHEIGEDKISNLLLNGNIFTPFLSSIIGLIPNCAGSVVITELYVNNVISFGSMLAGLLTGSGISILILFKVNSDLKENMMILGTIYIIGVIFGILFNLVGITI